MILGALATGAAAQPPPQQPLVADPNVNMVRGIGAWKDGRFDGDPYLQRQNEPSIAVSTRNPCHLVAGANDYRLVDHNLDATPLPNSEEGEDEDAAPDAWLGLFTSYDCGQKWRSTLVPGFPQDATPEGKASPVKGYQAAADPLVRAGANGLFFFSGLAFDRDADGKTGRSAIFVARLVDNNNKERGDTVAYLNTTVVASRPANAAGLFLDKPSLAVDIPRGNATCRITSPPPEPGGAPIVQTAEAGAVYVAYTSLAGAGETRTAEIRVTRSLDCGVTWTRPARISRAEDQINQGAAIAIDPQSGMVYVTWRRLSTGTSDEDAIMIARSPDFGERFDPPIVARSFPHWRPVHPWPWWPFWHGSAPEEVSELVPFDQGRTPTTFRTNALPSIAAAPGGLVYVAYAARGYHQDSSGHVLSDDARIVLAVSTDWGRTFAEPYAIDNDPARRGHQIMPALAYGAGLLQVTYYDFRDDFAEQFTRYVDEINTNGRRHTVDVRGAWAEAGPHPTFRGQLSGPDAASVKVTEFATSVSLGQVRWNPVNLPLYGQGQTPFIGDYLDTQAVTAFPVRSADGRRQEWRPNLGPGDATRDREFPASPFASSPIFHVAWTDNRDVKSPPPGKTWADYTAPGWSSSGACDPNLAGIRNANIYTSRLTPGLFVGSPGNTKPLGKITTPTTVDPRRAHRYDPRHRPPVPVSEADLIQRGFAVFVQNATMELKRFRLTIANPLLPGGRASFRQFDIDRTTGLDRGPLASLEVEIPRRSTVARTLYARSTEQYAQILVNVQEVELTAPPGSDPLLHPLKAGGLKASLILNPDLTNPKILEPDFVSSEVPQIADLESYEVGISAPVYLKIHGPKSSSRAIAVPKSSAIENPDVENPDIENPDVENPDVENPDVENPDVENPDVENPDVENPDVENPDVENTPEGDALSVAAIGDVQWTVKNKGNTTSAYRFHPTLRTVPAGLHFQLIVTRRYLLPEVNAQTCKPRFRVDNQEIVNIPAYTPDIKNPDVENPDVENPDVENPDVENPDVENVTFLLAPDESATVTLRLIKTSAATASPTAAAGASGPSDDLDAVARELMQGPPVEEDIVFSPRQETGAVVVPLAADTGETEPASAAAGADLLVSDPMPTLDTTTAMPLGQVALSFTIKNRGTSVATAYVGGNPANPATTIKTRFYLSTDNTLSPDDTYLGIYEYPGTIGVCSDAEPTACLVPHTQTLVIPRETVPGQYYVIAVVDDNNGAAGTTVYNEVFEADDYNNSAPAGPITVGFSLAFSVQPVNTTQDMYITPTTTQGAALPVTVVAMYGDGTPVTNPALVSEIAVSLGSNPAGGTLGGTLVRPVAGGYATFSDLRINNPSLTGTTYTLMASAGGAYGATSGTFAILADAPPVVANDAYSIPEDGTLVVPTAPNGLLANDRDPPFKGTKQPTLNPRPSPGCPDGWCIQALPGTNPAQGTLSLALDGSFSYVPPPNFYGPVTFTYLANDGRPGNNTTGTVTITVISVNDPPSFTKGADQTVAEDSGAHTVTGWATNISTGPNEASQTVNFLVSSDNPALFAAQPAISPTGTLTFTPALHGHGSAIVTVRLHDNGGTANSGVDTSVPQTFTITVTHVNHAPAAVGEAYVTGRGATLVIAAPGVLANDTDVDGDSLTAVLARNALHGTLTLNANGSFTYAPTAGFSGADSFGYRASDGSLTSGIADVNITVLADHFPVANADTATTPEDTAVVIPVLANDTDPDGDPLTVSAVTAPLHGTASITGSGTTVTYQPALNFNGSDSFTYTVSDGKGGTAVGNVSVTVTPVNDAPVAVNDTAVAIAGSTVGIDVLANDYDVESRLSLAVSSSVGFVPPGLPYNAGYPSELAVVPAAGRLYVGTTRAIAVYSLATNALDRLIPLQGQTSPALHRLDASAGVLYFRAGAAIIAVDVRPASPTFNQIVGTATFAANLNSFAVDDVRHRLFVVHAVNAGGAPTMRQLDVVDGNPASTGFLSIIASLSIPGSPIGVAVNSITNKIYVANSNPSTSLSGLYVVDVVEAPTLTFTASRITLADGTTGVPPCFDVVVDPSTNMVYGYGTASPNGNIVAVDAANGNAVTTIPVANFWAINVVGKMLAVNTVTHRVYAWAGDFYTPGKLVVIDGDRSSGTFKTVKAEIPLERDYCDVVVDETHNRVVTTAEMGAFVIDGSANSVAGIVRAKQLTCDIDVNPATGRAYVVNSATGFQVLNITGTPTEIAVDVTASEVGQIVVDPTRHIAYSDKTVGTASLLSVSRDGTVNTVPGLPTDAGRFLTMARNRATGKVYAANYGASASGGFPFPGFVAVIDGTTGAVIKTITVGDESVGIGINGVTNRIYVANTGDEPGSVSVIDGSTDTLLTTVATPPDIGVYFMRDVVANTTTNKVYLRTSYSASPLWVLDGVTNALSPVALPAGTATVSIIRVNSEKNRIYVGMSDGRLYVLNGADDSIRANLMVGYPSTAVGTQSYIAINETTDEVFVANLNNDTVTVLDYNGTVLATVNVGDGPTAVAVNELTNSVYVASANDKMLAIIDGSTHTLRGGLALPYQANFIAVDPGDRRVYASSGGSPQDVGLMVIADDPTGPGGTLTVSSVTNGAQGTTEVILNRLVLYHASASASGVDTFTYTASDGEATSNPATVTVTISPALTITTSSLPNGRSGQPYNQTILATGGIGARTWLIASGNIPSGTTLDAATGAIHGTPNMPGLYTFTVRVQDSAPVPQVATMMFSIGIGPLVITTSGLPSGWIGQPYSATLTAVPVAGTAVWSIVSGSLPAGLTLSSNGVISGTSNVYGSSSFTVKVTDNPSGEFATRSLSILIDAPLQIVTPLRDAILSQSYSVSVIGGRGTRNWTVIGTLPRGMSASPTNGITGSPLETGYFPLTVTVTDCASSSCDFGTPVQTDTKNVTLRAAAGDQSIGWSTSVTVPFGTAGSGRIAQIVTAGVTADLVSVMPNGISCPWPTVVTAEIRRLTATPPFAPDDSLGGLYASATVAMSSATSIPLDTPVFFPVGAKFAIVLTAAGACSMPTNTGSDYPAGQPFVFDGTSWQLPTNFFDFGMTTYVVPPPGLVYTTANRNNVVATPLLDGRILVTSDSSTAEVYDPSTRAFTATANNLQVSRSGHATALLTCPSGTTCGYHGKVLIAGGDHYDSTLGRTVSSNTAELYDPATNRFTVLAGTLTAARSQFTMTRLLNGTILIAGGQSYDPATGNWLMLRSAEIFDPASMTFTPIGDMLLTRRQHTATPLPNGKVLIVGGWTSGGNTTAELFEPSGGGGSFRATTGGTVDGFVRSGHTATLLANGNVVIAGGIGSYPDLGDTIEIYDPTTDRFTRAGTIAARRMNHAAVGLVDGRVLLAGGWDRWVGSSLPLASVEIYDPQTQTSSLTPSLIVTRSQAGIARLTCPTSNPGCAYGDDVLVVGGAGSSAGSLLTSRSGETIDISAATTGVVITTMVLPDGQTGQPYPGATLAATGGTPPYAFVLAAGNLPPRVLLETNGQVHSLPGNDPDTPGAFQFVARVTDSLGAQAYQSLTIRLNALTVTTATVPSAILNQAYDYSLAATGTTPFTWSRVTSAGGNLPPGLSFGTDGRITGTPAQTGCWTFVVQVRDGSYQTAIKSINLCINQPLQVNLPTAPWDLSVLQWFNTWLTASGGAQHTWSLALQPSEHLPLGLQLTSDGHLFGNVQEAGILPVTVRVTDNSVPPQSVTGQVMFRIGAQDQGQWSIDPSLTLPIDGGHQMAQVVRSGVTGRLLHVLLPVACTTGDLSVEIRGVAASGAPDNNSRASVVVPGAQLPPFQGSAYYRWIALPTPPSLTVNEHFSIVLSSAGECVIAQISEVQYRNWAYTFGDGFTGDGSTWTSLGPTSRPVLPFQTSMDPEGRLAFGPNWRDRHTATLLADGTVLLTGGTGNGPTAVIYDPVANTYTPTAGEMIASRQRHTATLMPDGKVLIVGGQNYSEPNEQTLATTEIYDPGTGRFTPGPSLTTGRGDHTATLLADGRVLIAGGHSGWNQTYQPLASTEILNGGAFTSGPSFAVTHDLHTATRLADGRVLIAGGAGGGQPHAEVFDPSAGTLTPTGQMNIPRSVHTATLVSCDGCPANRKVLIVGGWATNQPGAAPYAELYDPATNAFTIASGPLQTRQSHTATVLSDGTVLIAGGAAVTGESLASLELYDPATGQFTATGALAVSRASHTATRLDDGRVLLAFGGGNSSVIGISSEIYDPASPPPAAPITIQTTDPPKAYSGRAYNVQLSATGAGPFFWTLAPGSQPLPPGLSLTSGGLITGIPAEPTGWPVYPFTVRVIDTAGHSTTQSFSLIVERGLLITTTALVDGIATRYYGGGCVSSSGGSGTVTFSVVSGTLPRGLTLDPNGCWSGVVLDGSTHTFTVQATDSGSPPQVETKTLMIRSWAPDQQGSGGDWQNAVTIGGSNSQRLAQIVTARMFGGLAGVQVPVSCSSSALTVEIQGVTGTSTPLPDGNTLLSTTVTPTDPWTPIVFGGARFFAPDDRFAIVLSSTGTCETHGLATNDGYDGGEAWINVLGSWQSLAAFGGYPDLNFLTLVAPVRDFVYTWSWNWADTSVVLDDGRVAMASGANIETYDPATNTTSLGPPLAESRGAHTVTKLADGRIAVIGGEYWAPNANSPVLRDSAEIYDPATGTWSMAPGRLTHARGWHTATLLGNGKILVTGGLGLPNPDRGGFRPPFIEAEVFDLDAGSTPVTMLGARWGHRATALTDGKVLVTGGWTDGPAPRAEIFDPALNSFSETNGQMLHPRTEHTATLLANGKVLLAGSGMGSSDDQPSAEVYDPDSGLFAAVGPMAGGRQNHAAVRLADGSVLIAGGSDNCCGQPWHPLAGLERYDPGAHAFTPAGSLGSAREGSAMVLLGDGRAAIVGGGGFAASGLSIELLTPDATVAITMAALPDATMGGMYTSPPLTATGGSSPYHFSVVGGSLPPGLALAGDVITGVPTMWGTYRFTAKVTDSSDPVKSNYQAVTIRVSPLIITTTDLPVGRTGQPYDAQLTATGVSAVTWSVADGPWPDGLTLSPTGAITGSPTTANYYTFLVRAQDSVGQVATKWLSIQVGAELMVATHGVNDTEVSAGIDQSITRDPLVPTRLFLGTIGGVFVRSF